MRAPRREWLESMLRTGDPESGCWIWPGAATSDGYGTLWVEGRCRLVTHLVLEAVGLPRPPRAYALHSCDTPRCVNPQHLRWGDQWDNMREASSKGRIPNGTQSVTARYDADQIRYIRDQAAAGRSCRSIARELDTYPYPISRIVRRVSYRDVD